MLIGTLALEVGNYPPHYEFLVDPKCKCDLKHEQWAASNTSPNTKHARCLASEEIGVIIKLLGKPNVENTDESGKWYLVASPEEYLRWRVPF